MKNLLLTIIIAGSLSSCVSSSFRTKSSDFQTIRKGTIQQVSKIAEYEVKTEKVKGTYTGVYTPSTPGNSTKLAKELALGNAISDAKCDFLVHPLYDVSVNGNQITVSVEGYPAFYTRFKTYSILDTTDYSLNVEVPTSLDEETTTTKPNRNKKKALYTILASTVASTAYFLALASL
jgi:hypothetical protein